MDGGHPGHSGLRQVPGQEANGRSTYRQDGNWRHTRMRSDDPAWYFELDDTEEGSHRCEKSDGCRTGLLTCKIHNTVHKGRLAPSDGGCC
jgi:hypothetical protein